MTNNKIISLYGEQKSTRTKKQKEANVFQEQLNQIICQSIDETYSINLFLLDPVLEELLDMLENETHSITKERRRLLKNQLAKLLKTTSSLTTVSLIKTLSELYPQLFTKE